MNEHAADVLPLNAAPGEAQCVNFTLSSCCLCWRIMWVF